MYFWKIENLEQDLKKGIPEKESIKYFLILTVIYISSMFDFISNPNLYDRLIQFFILFFTIFQIIYLFKINKSDKQNSFLTRYFAIGFVTFIRSVVFILLPLIIAFIIIGFFIYGEEIPEKTTWFDLLFTIFYSFGYLFLQVKSFKKINS